ncbi:DNA translocase FtsK 4TM domain-containing protein, partial [Helicobacter sp. WB40]|uniref:DNA translocase FtsK 4TM domain-containing protein n=1 Tax=Helicobacter sp. WB40 TaxID=3004130 RepID=UPI0022EBE905
MKLDKLNNKTIIIGVIFFLWILEIFGASGALGGFGEGYSKLHYFLFGYLGYVWLLALGFCVYRAKNIPSISELSKLKFTTQMLEKALSIVILVLTILSLQSLFIEDSGIFGIAFNSVLQPIIGRIGVFFVIIFMFVFGYVLWSGKGAIEIFNNFKNDIKKDLQNIKKTNSKSKEFKLKTQSIEEIFLRIKAFFTPVVKENKDTKEIQEEAPRTLTLEELIEYDKENHVLSSNKHVKFDFSDESAKISEVEQEQEIIKEDDKEEIPTSVDIKDDISSKIRVIPIQEAKKQGYDTWQFQLDSMATLEKFKNLERYLQSKNIEEETSPIKLIKVDKQENYASEIVDIPDEVSMQYAQASSTIKEEKPKQVIKSYPQKLYAAIPFSSYYEKKQEPKDCLVACDDEVNEILNAVADDLQKAHNLTEEVKISEDDYIENDMLEIQSALNNELQEASNIIESANNNEGYVENEIVE